MNKRTILDLINCEIDCLKDGHSITPSEKDIIISSLENLKKRFNIYPHRWENNCLICVDCRKTKAQIEEGGKRW